MKIVLADREAEIMEVLWTRGPSTVAEVRDHLKDDLAYTTVLTILRTLEAKGYLGHDEEGRAHRYSPLILREAAQRSALRDLATKFFNGSSALLLMQLVHEEDLTKEDLERIRRLLARRTGRGSS
jgi:BlaI family transcriptional regulator, penicillinase repressor